VGHAANRSTIASTNDNSCLECGRSVPTCVRQDRLACHQVDRQRRRDICAMYESLGRDVSTTAGAIRHGQRWRDIQSPLQSASQNYDADIRHGAFWFTYRLVRDRNACRKIRGCGTSLRRVFAACLTLIGAVLRFRSYDAHLQSAAIDRYDVHWHSARVHDSGNMCADIEVTCSFT